MIETALTSLIVGNEIALVVTSQFCLLAVYFRMHFMSPRHTMIVGRKKSTVGYIKH
jgi:hypothetical protein